MGYTVVETDNAKYIVSLELHAFRDYSYFEKYTPDVTVGEGPPLTHEQFHDIRKLVRDYFEKRPGVDLSNEPPIARQFLSTPFVCVDPFVTKLSRALFDTQSAASVLASAYGVYHFLKGVKNARRKKPSRRDFLAGAGFLAASGLLAPHFDKLSALPGELKGGRKAVAWAASEINRYVNPVVIGARNAIIAEKMESVVAPLFAKRLGRKPIIAIQIGASHEGIVRDLKHPERRRQFIQENASFIRTFCRKDLIENIEIYSMDRRTNTLEREQLRSQIKPIMEHRIGMRDNAAPPRVAKLSEQPRVSRRAFFGSILPKSRSPRRR